MENQTPLPLAWMIHDDSTKLHPQACIKIFLFFPSCSSSPNPFFSLHASKFAWCRKNGRKRERNWFYNLLASKFYVWFWYYGWKENEEKWFIKCPLLSTRVKTQFSSINPHTPIYSHKSTH